MVAKANVASTSTLQKLAKTIFWNALYDDGNCPEDYQTRLIKEILNPKLVWDLDATVPKRISANQMPGH
jgi:hypothetical protein